MFKKHNCLIGVTNSDNLVIFKVRNSKVDLKDNLINNSKTRMRSNFIRGLRYSKKCVICLVAIFCKKIAKLYRTRMKIRVLDKPATVNFENS